jgi:hypothetical protein
MAAMDIVALRGVFDDKSLLQLSATGSRSVTRPARHNAMKRQMQIRMAIERLKRAGNEETRILTAMEFQRNLLAFSSIATSTPVGRAQMTALNRVTAMNGGPVAPRQVWQWANDFRDPDLEEGAGEEESEEEGAEEDVAEEDVAEEDVAEEEEAVRVVARE